MSIQSIGIDVSKQKLDVALYSNTKEFSSFVFENSQKGFEKLETLLQENEAATTAPCVLESTGMYHLPVSLMLRERGRRVNCINPIITKVHQLASIRKTKTDKIDAQRLAYIGVVENNLPEFTKQNKDIYLKRIVRMIATLDKEIQRLKLATRNFSDFVNLLNLPKVHCEELRVMVKQMESLKKKLVASLVSQIPEVSMFENIPGISTTTGAIVLAAIQGTKFKDKDSLVAYTGLDVSVRQSGLFRGKGKLSKRGNAFVRKILHQIAWGLKQHNQIYRTYYESLRMRNKHYTTCLNAIARKFLRYLFTQIKYS